jgi:hypothetical protein
VGAAAAGAIEASDNVTAATETTAILFMAHPGK